VKPETRAIHAGNAPDPATGAVAPPIQLATTFVHGPAAERHEGPEGGHEYQRESHPTQSRLEAALATIEGGAAALAFATGMAAIHALLSSLARGSRVLVPRDVYSGTRVLAREFLPELGIEPVFVDMTDPAAVRVALIDGAACVWVETPSNPRLEVSDLAAIAEAAHAAGAIVACDNTFATPALQHPLALGADVVMHSTTKYLGGHSDVMGGALVFARRDALHARVAHRRHLTGATLAPFNAWLILRGIRTLYVRVAQHCRNARAIAEFLVAHPKVARVHYPGLSGDPGHAVARRQMRDYGGMVSFAPVGGRDAALEVCRRVRLFTNATSLGGVESLIEHRASVEGAQPVTADDLVRLSVGLEHADDLIADLAQALDGPSA
jgi:cystathionine gamma-synthase